MGKGAMYTVAQILLIIGGLNWGLVGLGGFTGGSWNIVDMVLGENSGLTNIVYLIVGLAALYAIYGMTQRD